MVFDDKINVKPAEATFLQTGATIRQIARMLVFLCSLSNRPNKEAQTKSASWLILFELF